MPRRVSLVINTLCCVLTLAVLATSCGLVGSDEPTVASFPQPTAPPLLPAPSQPVAAADSSDAATVTAPQPTASLEVPPVEVQLPESPPDSLSCLSARRRAAQLLLPLLTQPELAGAQAFAQAGELGGIGLLGTPNSELPADLTALQNASFLPVLVASDEEGGSVQRLSYLGPIPSAAEIARLKSPEDVRKQWVEYGARVHDAGIDVVFGPVLDVGGGPGIESRSFSADPAVVTEYGNAVAAGLLEAGVLPVFKHFPGHGSASADSHLELPVTPSLEDLRASDLLPYVTLLSDPVYRDQAAVMIGHLAVPGLSGELPTSLSSDTINGLLRGELGFRGLVFSDAINMGAIVNSYGRLDALELSLRAGTDVIILGSLADVTPALDHLVMLAESDPSFAVIVDNRAARVMAAKGQTNFCAGAG